MSQSCPLCGKPKPEEALFCDDCTRKIHTEYEVDIPEETGRESAPAAEDIPVKESNDKIVNSLLSRQEIDSEDDSTVNNPVDAVDNKPKVEQEANVNEAEIETESGTKPAGKEREREVIPQTKVEMGTESEAESEKKEEMVPEEVIRSKTELNEAASNETEPKKKKRIGIPVLFVLMIALLVGAFFVYNATIRKRNLDRSGWDAAVKENSVEGYLAYMEAHPRGTHFDEAQEGLFRLKSQEATTWERMKETDNVTELRDFLDRHPGSPYIPLVKTRLDSLIWIGTLQMNTPESYSDYIMLAENGGIRGDYIAEARKRYELLFSSQSADVAVLDSIRTTVDGFFISLSSLNHTGMFRFLAPTVYRFFDSGAATRERITGELLVAGARAEGATLKFIPDLQSVKYEVTSSNHYKVNVPLQKTYPKDGATVQVHGYIVHIELDPLFQIVSIFETKPYPEAP